MRAVILCIAGLFFTLPANAGSLVPDNTGYTQKNEAKDLQLPTFSDGSQADALSFNSIGQAGSVEIFDLGGKSAKTSGGDLFQGLEQKFGGETSILGGKTSQTE
ncbi:hypothetical protein EOI86_00450 [Hwanghaeella grinnelliae]|uniref:Uncharacterized protein n=1 Tax=Hwanghaeella grinnelliae TaxID=2500179 RepID=A0A3S2WAB7_9PROT|nr:hypothetical protein [Hwanghaeella grinnelliae]RVU37810.1 hypothetical protein EOI86_00450 [Hwanghaeella grinnelliae]